MNIMIDYRSYPVTLIFIGINVIIFILINLKKIDVSSLGSSYMMTLQEKQYYRVVTAAFTQKEFLHLLCNMYSLYNIGSMLEYSLDSFSFAVCYVVIMICGGLLSARIHKKSSPFILFIGASGVLCGLLGIYMVMVFTARGFSGLRVMNPTILILIIMTASKKIDSIGHFTGLFIGILCGIVGVSFFGF